MEKVEAILFVSDKPASLSALCEAIGAAEPQVREAVDQLSARLRSSGSLQVVQIAGGFQLCTKPEFAELVATYLKPQKQRLSRSIMEVLAIVAYQQPITLAEIEAVRGLHSDYGLRQLLERRLVREVGRRQSPGRPVLYGTTQQFLHQFNMQALDDLPILQLSVGKSHPGELPAPKPNEPPALPGL